MITPFVSLVGLSSHRHLIQMGIVISVNRGFVKFVILMMSPSVFFVAMGRPFKMDSVLYVGISVPIVGLINSSIMFVSNVRMGISIIHNMINAKSVLKAVIVVKIIIRVVNVHHCFFIMRLKQNETNVKKDVFPV